MGGPRLPITKRCLRCAWLYLAFLAAAGNCAAKTAVVLSTDVGNEIDDQWAITYMMANPELDVLGIISAHAPSLPDPSAHYTYLILKTVIEQHLGLAVHPPLFEGSSWPLSDTKAPRRNAGVDFLIAASKNFSKDHRLTVLTIGAATDVASAMIEDPTIVDRIRVIAMAFKSLAGGDEYNVANDVKAWQILLDSEVPITVGSGDVCRANLALSFQQAKDLIASHGPIGAWLWSEYRSWYFRHVKPLRTDDFTKPWIIWDTVVLASLEGMTSEQSVPRPMLNADQSFGKTQTRNSITWITGVDSRRMWKDFLQKLDVFSATHAVECHSIFGEGLL